MPRLLTSKVHGGLRLGFDYSYTINKDNRTAKVECSLTPYPYSDNVGDPISATYHFIQGTTSIKLDWGSGSTSKPWEKFLGYRESDGTEKWTALCDSGSYYDKNYNGKFMETWNGNAQGYHWLVFMLGTKFYTKSFTVNYTKSGHASFKVDVDFAWYASKPGQDPAERQTIKKTEELPDIDPYYDITYNLKGGSKGPSAGKKYKDKAFTVPNKTPTKEGYDFVNWSITRTSDGSNTGSTVNPGGKISASSNHDYTLVAVWEKKKIPIRYDADGGTGAPKDGVKYYDKEYTVSTTKPTKEGYDFINWRIDGLKDSSGNPINVNSGANIKANRNNEKGYKLVARWKAKTYKIILKDHPKFSADVFYKFNQTYGEKLSDENKQKFKTYKREGYKQLVTKNGDPYWVTQLTPAGKAIYDGPRSQEEKNKIYEYSFDYFYDKKYTIASDLTLFPVLEYSTTCYVKHEGKWKLAIPYVKVSDKWKQALMYSKNDGKWKL